MARVFLVLLAGLGSGISLYGQSAELSSSVHEHNSQTLKALESVSKGGNGFVSGLNLLALQGSLRQSDGLGQGLGLRGNRPRMEGPSLLVAHLKSELASFDWKVGLVSAGKWDGREPVSSFEVKNLEGHQTALDLFRDVNRWGKEFSLGAVVEPFRIVTKAGEPKPPESRFIGSLSVLDTAWGDRDLIEAQEQALESDTILFRAGPKEDYVLPAINAMTSVRYAETFEGRGVELPLDGRGKIRVAVIVKDESARAGASLTVKDWENFLETGQSEFTDLSLPALVGSLLRETSSYSVVLPSKPLLESDLKKRIDGEIQRFSDRTRISLPGKEASHVQSGRLRMGIVPGKSFSADSPFFFVIFDSGSGAILSAYHFADPQAWVLEK
jgi:hypothetical protein